MRRAFAFLTILGGSAEPTPTTFAWFPLVGAVLGLVVGAVWWVTARHGAPLLAGAVALVVDLALTGLLHVDGLADAGDGLLAPMSRERRLAVMADPVIGAFGAVSVVAVLLVRLAAFASARPAPFIVAALWCASRTAMVLITQVLPYAREGGIVGAFLDRGHRVVLGASIVVGLAGSVALGARCGLHGVLSVLATLLGAGIVAALAARRLGGYTGDVLGASGVVGETLGLVVWALR
ncbi:MAG: adenosylcobinamide-GDP ribazoletransferase [Acidimicrobiales bacterium]